ncbi:amyloid protein-binding protein 2-like [Penaeus japonicus]|uniref:amyloid protein-binding protein 2-like n=1 Tax=Penaeus japonicus TaxID=27405 RepID=UPI001C71664D|nr:amyloid protein-binding protein 2-like [Penaeus japonicus]
MASASILKWFPGTLYNSALNVVVMQYKAVSHELRIFPPPVQFDVLYKLYKCGCLLELRGELCDLDVLTRMLKVVDKRHLLHHCFQALMDQALADHSTKISTVLSQTYVQRCNQVSSDQQQIDNLVLQGLAVSSFLAEAGWLPDAENILTACQALLADSEIPQQMTRSLECCHRLLHVQNGYCRFEEAERIPQPSYAVGEAFAVSWSDSLNFSSLGSEFSLMMLRQSAKACVLKREFKKAGLLIKQKLPAEGAKFDIRNEMGVADHGLTEGLGRSLRCRDNLSVYRSEFSGPEEFIHWPLRPLGPIPKLPTRRSTTCRSVLMNDERISHSPISVWIEQRFLRRAEPGGQSDRYFSHQFRCSVRCCVTLQQAIATSLQFAYYEHHHKTTT